MARQVWSSGPAARTNELVNSDCTPRTAIAPSPLSGTSENPTTTQLIPPPSSARPRAGGHDPQDRRARPPLHHDVGPGYLEDLRHRHAVRPRVRHDLGLALD